MTQSSPHRPAGCPTSTARPPGPVRAARPPGRARVVGLLRHALVALLVALASIVPAAALAPAGAAGDATETLAQQYSPIVVVREQPTPCGDGEPYAPAPVQTVLGSKDVVLHGPDGQSVPAPTAADLAGKGDGWYLDYPGEPLTPGCDYETWFRGAGQGKPPTVYAHLATDPAYPGKVALQYWFFYVYNDWNDKHEGDWEMIQLLFDAPTAEAALRVAPESVAYAQHEGSQVTPWTSPTLVKEGDHPVVYPGQGSHAAYITQAQWFGKSAAAGFGCDNTTAPGVRVDPAVVVIPSGATPATGDLAWLSFTGRWGQKAPSFNNGPTGPATKTQWTQPVTWQVEEGRPEAVALPPVAGPALGAFCSLTERGSLLFIDLLASPWLVLLLVLALLALIVALVMRTDWRHARPEEPDLRRRAGQVITAAFGWVRRHLVALAGIVLGLVVLLGGSLLLQRFLLRPRPGGSITDVDGLTSRWFDVLTAVFVAVIVVPLASWLLSSVIALVRDRAEGRGDSGSGTALAEALRERSGLWVTLLLYLVVSFLSGSLLLLPVAAWLLSRWGVAPAAAVIEHLPVRAAFARSSQLTAGHRWRTLLLTGSLLLVGFSLAGVVGTLTLLVTPWPLWVSTLLSVVLLAVLLPVAFTGIALQFYDLRRRAEGEVPAAAPAPVTG